MKQSEIFLFDFLVEDEGAKSILREEFSEIQKNWLKKK